MEVNKDNFYKLKWFWNILKKGLFFLIYTPLKHTEVKTWHHIYAIRVI